MRTDYSIFGGPNPQHQINANARAQYGKARAGAQTQAPSPAGAGSGVQTGFNAAGQAANAGSIMGRLDREGGLTSANLDGDGGRAMSDLAKSQSMANASTVGRGLEQQNAEHHMKDQAAQSELLQAALSNQTKQYSDLAQRQVSQIGLASQLQNALIKHSLLRK
jgi:hypothetical protein